jgi:hypothetical protein
MGDSGGVKRKVLQDYANTVCDMFVGWRLAVSGDDIPRLIEIGSGDLELNLLDGAVVLNGSTPTELGIAREVVAWLQDRCAADGVPMAQLQEARLHVAFTTSERRAKNGHPVRDLDFSCASRIVTDERTYEGSLAKRQVWVGSTTGAPWVVQEQ